jgi:hypothetical protein
MKASSTPRGAFAQGNTCSPRPPIIFRVVAWVCRLKNEERPIGVGFPQHKAQQVSKFK